MDTEIPPRTRVLDGRSSVTFSGDICLQQAAAARASTIGVHASVPWIPMWRDCGVSPSWNLNLFFISTDTAFLLMI
jgi:hypothetical protein